MELNLNSPVEQLQGIAEERRKKLNKLGIFTIEDLLYWLPREYYDLRKIYDILDAPENTACCVHGIVENRPTVSFIRNGMTVTKLRISDGQFSMDIIFFNQIYVRNVLFKGDEYVFYGNVEVYNNRKQMTNPMFENVRNKRFTGKLMPIYSLTAGISNYTMSEFVRQAIKSSINSVREILPDELRQKYGFPTLKNALIQVHIPEDYDKLEIAKKRVVFEEFFVISASLQLLKNKRYKGSSLKCKKIDLQEFYQALPFTLTNSQKKSITECVDDMCADTPMNRLVQGDVGSGKTIVAAACAWFMIKNGYQVAFMCPTEILAEQHYKTLNALFEKFGMHVGLLTGSLKAKQRREILECLQLGMIDLLIGTHALISDSVYYPNLGLVITDEQHRFGVNQRAKLADKGLTYDGTTPHVLVMSATPIPRTLALLVYGDLDVSIIDEKPPGRQDIDTFCVTDNLRQRVYNFVSKQIEENHQVYIVCPAVSEENPDGTEAVLNKDVKAVEKYAKDLQDNIFPNYKIGIVHGRMKSQVKDAIMSQFISREIDILVATTVIEVGVDVPNATLMLVENAERFGLSQLHQLRGRVGRGENKSYCILISNNRNPETLKRLKSLCSTNDGFKIAESDLEMRGPGDFFGTQQHGLPQLKSAKFAGDTKTLYAAQQEAVEMLKNDPYLSAPEHSELNSKIRNIFENTKNNLN